MPIEPTSVSKPAVREVEKTSAIFASWTSLQGSSTGGKDRPSNSIWEKAISGAQKLFGLDASESPHTDEKNDQEARSEASNSLVRDNSFHGVPGFGNRAFGSYGRSSMGGSAFGSVVTSRLTRSPSEVSEGINSESLATKQMGKVGSSASNASREADARRSDSDQGNPKELDADEDGEENGQAKASGRKAPSLAGAATVQSALPGSIGSTSATSGESILTNRSQNSTTPQAVSSANTPEAPQRAAVASANTQPNASNVGKVVANKDSAGPRNAHSAVTAGARQIGTAAPSETGANVAGKSDLLATSADAKQTPTASVGGDKPIVSQAVLADGKTPAANGASKLDMTVAKPIAQEAPKPIVSGEKSPPPDGQPSQQKPEGLAVDAGKARNAISEGVAKASVTTVRGQGQGSQSANPTQPTTAQSHAMDAQGQAAKPVANDGAVSRLPEGSVLESKDAAQLGDASKRDAIGQAQNRVARQAGNEAAANPALAGRVSSGEASHADAKAGIAAQSQGQSQSGATSREIASVVAGRVQPQNAIGKSTTPNGSVNPAASGVAGVGAASGVGADAALQGARQGGQQGGDASAKQDFDAVLRQHASSKAGEKSGAESSQSFDAKMEAATANRRSEAASKARQTSYVSKTAEELKEVVATLTKSIDRLVSSKPGTMSLKLSFEGGGTMNLRISMEGNQVSASMQTDVVGLETAIKSHWSELANDWNAKGVKLSPPQFQNSEAGSGKGGFEDLSQFAQKGERQSDSQGFSREGRGRSGSSQGPRGFDTTSADTLEADTPLGETESSPSTANSELKTYA